MKQLSPYKKSCGCTLYTNKQYDVQLWSDIEILHDPVNYIKKCNAHGGLNDRPMTGNCHLPPLAKSFYIQWKKDYYEWEEP